MTENLKGWRFEHIGFEGDGATIDGHDLWASEWTRIAGKSITATHPSYPSQMHKLAVYHLGNDASEIVFAAGEVSNGVWVIYRKISTAEA